MADCDGTSRCRDVELLLLQRRLPRIAGRRAVAETREHLRDAAERHVARGLSRADAERAAVEDFGLVESIAPRLAAEIADRGTRGAAALGLGATLVFVFPLYVVPENTLPPAPWVEKPRDIAVLQLVMVALWAAAGALALAATAVSCTRLSKLTAPVLTVALVALAGSVVAGVALTVRWFSHAPSTSNAALQCRSQLRASQLAPAPRRGRARVGGGSSRATDEAAGRFRADG